MADKEIFIDSSPKNPDVKLSPFDWTYTTNVSARFGRVNMVMCKYLPAKAKLDIDSTQFGFDLHPLKYPVQTNVRCHIKIYKVPLRILWDDAEDFFSSIGTDGLPTNQSNNQFVVPYIARPHGWNALGTLAEQIGCNNRRYTTQTSIGSELITFAATPYQVLSTGLVPGVFTLPAFNSRKAALFWPVRKKLSIQQSSFEKPYYVFQVRNTNTPFPAASFKVVVFRYLDTESFDDEGILSRFYADSSVDPSFACRSRDRFLKIAEFTPSLVVSDQSSFGSHYMNVTDTSTMVDGHTSASSSSLISLPITVIDQINQLIDSDAKVFVGLFALKNTFAPSSSVIPPTQNLHRSEDLSYNETTEKFSATINIDRSLGALPWVDVAYEEVVNSEVDYYDQNGSHAPKIPICALPFRAYEFLRNYYFRNVRIDPFIKNGKPCYNKFLTNTASGADSTTPIDFFDAYYEKDYFTSCVKEPQFGNAPLVGVTVNDMGDKGILRFEETNTYNNYSVEVPLDAEGKALPLTMYNDIADKPNVHRLQELINFGISINDLRNVSTFQRMLERMQRTDYRFENVMYEFFGTHPPVGDHYPQYIGGFTRDITTKKISNVAESDGHPLGSFAGTAFFVGNDSPKISLYTTEPSYVIALQYLTVTPTYSQYLPKHLLYKDPLDFYVNPEFAFVGPQPVYKKELAPNQLSADHLEDVFGYNRPYAELFSNVDEVHGLFQTDMANFLLQRLFDSSVALNKNFIEIHSQDLLNIFSVTLNDDKAYGQIRFQMKAWLPAPRSYSPHSI